MLKGLIDPAKEVEKLNKKKAALQQTVEKLQKVFRIIFSIANFTKYFQAMEVADYATKVPEEVRAANTEKLETSRLEIERLCEAVTTLAKI